MTKHNDEVVFAVSTGFGANTQQPYVQVLIEAADWMTQMPPEAARELALNLLTAAESADGDGFLMSFFKERLGVTDVNQRAGVLIDFREYREALRKDDEERKLRSLFPGHLPGSTPI